MFRPAPSRLHLAPLQVFAKRGTEAGIALRVAILMRGRTFWIGRIFGRPTRRHMRRRNIFGLIGAIHAPASPNGLKFASPFAIRHFSERRLCGVVSPRSPARTGQTPQ